ncbi:MAG: RNA polymerase sigma factor [Pyrinomonadaceae bacterium MAG19_C2-C3]|nr:RNA polymerase sigma factor [Pyrinomonadaceae bacterium MAG19_C2-C3]
MMNGDDRQTLASPDNTEINFPCAFAYDSLSDGELIERVTSHADEEAFVFIFHRHQAAIYRFVLHLSGSVGIAEDVCQEVFIALMRQSAQFDSTRGTLGAYLFGVARHLTFRHLERQRMYVNLEGEDDHPTMTNTATNNAHALHAMTNPLDEFTRDEDVRRVRQAILTLPVHYREVIVLCELHEKTYDEAAEVLGCAVGTIRSRLHRARALLAARLQPTTTKDTTPELLNARCFA